MRISDNQKDSCTELLKTINDGLLKWNQHRRVNPCPSGTYEDPSGWCKLCDANCKICYGKGTDGHDEC